MSLSRRRFIASAATGGAMLALSGTLRARGRASSEAAPSPRCALLDLGDECGISESLAGYERALGGLGADRIRLGRHSVPDCGVLIVAAALGLAPWLARLIRGGAASGATVIVESGAAFAEGNELRAHREAFRGELGIDVGEPVALWPRPERSGGIPYVDYGWPIPARVRDFSRALPVASHAPGAEVIARVGDIPVGVRSPRGRGMLIVLGSPLGPALLSGDAEARSWLLATVSMPG